MPRSDPSHKRLPSVWNRIVVLPYMPLIGFIALSAWMKILTGGRFLDVPVVREVPYPLVLSYIVLVAIGGLVAIVGGVTQRNRLETSGLVLLLVGVAGYGVVATYQLGEIGEIPVSVAVALTCLIRLHALSVARKAEQAAVRIAVTEARRGPDA